MSETPSGLSAARMAILRHRCGVKFEPLFEEMKRNGGNFEKALKDIHIWIGDNRLIYFSYKLAEYYHDQLDEVAPIGPIYGVGQYTVALSNHNHEMKRRHPDGSLKPNAETISEIPHPFHPNYTEDQREASLVKSRKRLAELELERAQQLIHDKAEGEKARKAKILNDAGFTSVAAVATKSKKHFISAVSSGDSGISDSEAAAIYDHAIETNTRNHHAIIALQQALQGTGLAAIDGKHSSATGRLATARLSAGGNLDRVNLDSLFGGMDADACDECNSVTSPAAYFVELLEFLRSNNLENTGSRGIVGTVLEKLFERRPDLGNLQLTCTNTKTILPYLDLANEVMESFIVYLGHSGQSDHNQTKAKIEAHNNTSPTCGNLLAEPENMNDDAYKILSSAVYPFNKLPYHQPLDEIRIFLKYLKTSRYEILDTFGPFERSFETEDIERTTSELIHATPLNREMTADYLSLIEKEYIALTGEGYQGPPPSGMPKWWEFWGYTSNNEASGQLKYIKKQFLPRMGIQFSDLIELLNTEYINPNFPRGKALAIFQSVHFEFKALNNLIDTETNWEYTALIDFMVENQHKSPSGCNNGRALSREEIADWVENTFSKIAMMVVINDPEISGDWHLDNAVLTHLDGSSLVANDFMRMQQFVQLWRKMGWSIDEMDKAISGLSKPRTAETKTDLPLSITPHLLDQLVAVKKLQEITGLELLKLLTFWATISTRGEESLYSRLFLTNNLANTDPVFIADEYGNYFTKEAKLSDHTMIIMAALGLTKAGLDAIVQKEIRGDQRLTIETVSILYRYSLMSKILHVTPIVLFQIRVVFGDLFESASLTLEFLEHWRRMEDVGISFAQLEYALTETDDLTKPVGLSELKIVTVIKSLFDGVQAIEAAHPMDVDEGTATKEFLTEKLSLLYDDAFIEKIHGVLEDTIVWSVPIMQPEKAPRTIKIQGTNLAGRGYTEIKEEFDADVNYSVIESVQTQLRSLLGLIIRDFQPLLDKFGLQRRLYFLKFFLPHLRVELVERFITSAISSAIGIPDEAVRELLSDLQPVQDHSDYKTALDHLANITPPDDYDDMNGFTGYLMPASTNSYTFTTISQSESPSVEIDGRHINLDGSSVVTLEGGHPYSFHVVNGPLNSLGWKEPRGPTSAIPKSILLSEYVKNKIAPTLVKLMRTAIVMNGCNLSIDELKYISNDCGEPLGLVDGRITFDGWKRLLNYLTLRNSLPRGKEESLLQLFRWASGLKEVGNVIIDIVHHRHDRDITLLTTMISDLASDTEDITEIFLPLEDLIGNLDPKHPEVSKLTEIIVAEEMKILLRKLAELLQVKEDIINALLIHFGWNEPRHFTNVTGKLVAEVESLQAWGKPSEDFDETRKVAKDIRAFLKSRLDNASWKSVIKPLHDELRIHQRDALTAYLVVQPALTKWGVTDADSLFEYFLIDVQMGACLETSRIKQAISTVQLFVQRCLCGLEEANGVASDMLDRERWEWMQRYRTWEANRKVFLYPENWIEPSLRDDKSPVFKELESDLLQKDLNQKTMEDAIKNYLSRLDEIAKLHIVSIYTDSNERTHIFGRTRGAPYCYYYRVYTQKGKTWKPWEKMQVDIPHYEDHEAWGYGGTFLRPVVWMGRLIVFIPEFTKQVVTDSPPEHQIKNADGEKHSGVKPMEYWEIRVGWTEYRNGKWTPKRLASGTACWPSPKAEKMAMSNEKARRGCRVLCYHDSKTSGGSGLILAFKFQEGQNPMFHFSRGQLKFSRYDSSTPEIDRCNDDSRYPGEKEKAGVHYEFGAAISQNTRSVYSHDNYVIEGSKDSSPSFITRDSTMESLSHEFCSELLCHTASASTLDNLYNEFHKLYMNEAEALGDLDGGSTVHELRSPYGLYNWELGFHVPILLIDKLTSSHQYETALSIARYVFNPLDNKSVWKWRPFTKISTKHVLESIFRSLTANSSSEQITSWREAPYQPHGIARSRKVAYMKWIVMKYINILIAAGDQLFRQNTLESVPLAIQYYILAAHLYGPPGEKIPKRGKRTAETFNSLTDRWDAFGNAVVNFETAFPYARQSNSTGGSSPAIPNILGTSTAIYFSLPENDKLRTIRATIDDRLFKIRHCQDIDGNTRRLSLFEPPIDPAALVQAAGQGLSLSNLLQDLNAPMPNYRFRYLLQKAFEMVQELKAMGGAFLAAKEKKDSEKYQVIKASYENRINTMVLEMKKLALEEAEKSLASLREARKGPDYRLRYYSQIIGRSKEPIPTEDTPFQEHPQPAEVTTTDSPLKLIASEQEELDRSDEATDLGKIRDGIEATSALYLALPSITQEINPFGVGISLSIGPQTVAQVLASASRSVGAQAAVVNSQSSGAARVGAILRQLQERVQAANSAGYEVKNIDSQIAVQHTRIAIAKRDIELQQKYIDTATEKEQFLHSKYSNEDLYVWQEKQLRELYHQTYTIAYELARKAEKTFCFERGPSATSFIQGTWDVNKDGLFSGEALHLALKRLETAYQEHRGHDYELSKDISVRSLDPRALLSLREQGYCEFELPELLFDMDFPGHYMRRIKTVSLTLPCVAGPRTEINCTLRLVTHSHRFKPSSGNYSSTTPEDFRTDVIPIEHIAISHGQKDPGVFELNFNDERYLPFEGAGAISKWRLELSPLKRFDYRRITDMVLHLRYTAIYGGDGLKNTVKEHVQKKLAAEDAMLWAVFDAKNEFAEKWAQFKIKNTLEMIELDDRLPSYADNMVVKEIQILTSADVGEAWVMKVLDGKGTREIKFANGQKSPEGLMCYKTEAPLDEVFGTWTITLNTDELKKSQKSCDVNDLLVLAKYTLG